MKQFVKKQKKHINRELKNPAFITVTAPARCSMAAGYGGLRGLLVTSKRRQVDSRIDATYFKPRPFVRRGNAQVHDEQRGPGGRASTS